MVHITMSPITAFTAAGDSVALRAGPISNLAVRPSSTVPNPYLAAFKAARAFFTKRASTSANAPRRVSGILSANLRDF